MKFVCANADCRRQRVQPRGFINLYYRTITYVLQAGRADEESSVGSSCAPFNSVAHSAR